MPILKMTEDKVLAITKSGNTFEDENNAEVFKIILPRIFNGNDMKLYTTHLCIVNPDNIGDEVNITELIGDYGNEFYVAYVDITNKYTYKTGEISLWINILSHETQMVAKTNVVTYTINKHLDVENYIPKQNLSLLDDFTIRVEQELNDSKTFVSEIKSYIDKVFADNTGGTVTVDDALSDTSTNPVQNKVVTAKITDIETTIGNVNSLLTTI